jgi:hypothetical protein
MRPSLVALALACTVPLSVNAQAPALVLPRASQRATVSQTMGSLRSASRTTVPA